jgi:predicted nicotinamide N-methyase
METKTNAEDNRVIAVSDGVEEDEEDGLGAIGFMFDSMHSRKRKSIVVCDKDPSIMVTLSLIGEDPGHVQSGQYLWPAALFAARHLIRNWDIVGRATVIELGSGCGLAGLVSAMLPSSRLVVLTDYDPGCLSLLQDNLKINREDGNIIADVRIFPLEWGKPSAQVEIENGYELVIGTDLLYCVEVVRPLLTSVAHLINKLNGLFILVSSFEVGEVSC